jgi:dimethylamine monooxygenase subunit A
MSPILHKTLPLAPWMDPRTARLPGVMPMAPGADWAMVDEAFAGQMALRDRLIGAQPAAVLGQMPQGIAAAEELYDYVLARLGTKAGYALSQGGMRMTRPDGVEVPLDRGQPLATLGRLVQEDLCLMEREGDQHVLTGACLCFPASWSLAEKLGRPLTAIHRTVESYDGEIARRDKGGAAVVADEFADLCQSRPAPARP